MSLRSVCYTSYEWCEQLDLLTGLIKGDQLTDGINCDQLKGKIKYWICQMEECPDTKSWHMQGYIEFHKQHTMESIKTFLKDKTMHIESRKGSQNDAIDYCRKEESRIGGPWEWGVKKVQGWRGDLDEIKEVIMKKGYNDAFLEYPAKFIQYGKGLREYSNLLMRSVTNHFRIVTVKILWGDAGTGKTMTVYKAHGFDKVYSLNISNGKLWFDGYNNEDVLLIDDFNPDQIPLETLLKLLDGYPHNWEIKGGTIKLAVTKIYLTSNYDPKHWYGGYPHSLARRINEIKEFKVGLHGSTPG